MVEGARAELVAELLARRHEGVLRTDLLGGGLGVGGRARGRQQQVEQLLLHVAAGLVADRFLFLAPHHLDRDRDEVAHHRLDVAAHVSDLGELGGLDLQERAAREVREPARDLGLADAGGPDHEDVLGRHLGGHLGGQRLAADAVAQRDRDRALRLVLADHVAVELGHDLARGEAARRRQLLGTGGQVDRHSVSTVTWSFV
jgi:hypothetical protein